MPTRTNKRTGEVQQLGPDGQWVTVKAGNPDAPAMIQTRGPDPLLPPRIAITNNQARASQFAPAKAQADATTAQAEAANAGVVANAKAREAEANAKVAELTASGRIKLTPEVRKSAIDGYTFAQQLDDIANGLAVKFNAGPGATHGLEGLKDYLPFTVNQQFDTAANKARGIVGQTLGFTGGQLNTPREAEQAIGPFLPQSSDRDQVAIDKINALRDLARQGREKAIQTLGGVPDENGNIIPVSNQAVQPQAPDQTEIATGKTRSQVDPVLKATGQRVGAMIARGVPDNQIVGFLQQSGVDPASTNINQVLEFRRSPQFNAWLRQHPGQAYDVGPEFYTKQVPMSSSRRLFNKTAATDIGGTAAATLAASANAIAGDRLGSAVGVLSGDPQAAQTGIQLLRTNHPVASLAGDLAGQASLETAAGLIPGAQGLLATRMGRRLGDIAYGAYSGSGDNADDAGVGAVTGGALGGIGGMAFRGFQKGIGNTFKGVQDAGVGYLHSKGIPLTLGQIARGVGTVADSGNTNVADEVGKGVAGIEERLAGIPALEAWIKTARQRGDIAFNKEAFNQIAPGVAGTGAEGLASAKAAEQAAYDKIKGAVLNVDPQFQANVAAIGADAGNLLHHGSDVASVVKDIQGQIASGGMTGEGYQTALRSIRKTRAGLARTGTDIGGKATDALNNLEGQVLDLGAAQGGTLGADLANANAIHARREIVKAASSKSSAQAAGEMFSPKDLNTAAVANTKRFGGLDRALSPDRPFYDLTTNGMAAMPSLTPDSGTAGRYMLYRELAKIGGVGGGLLGGGLGFAGNGDSQGTAEGAATGIGGGIAGGLTLGALLSAPYSKTGQRVIQNALLAQRPRAITRLGDFLVNNTRLAGLAGQAGLRDYFQQPELPQ
jgi:hypothetical protein